MRLEKFVQHLVSIEADGRGIGANKRSPEDTSRPSRDVVALEGTKQTNTDLRVRSDRFQGDSTTLALCAQASPQQFD